MATFFSHFTCFFRVDFIVDDYGDASNDPKKNEKEATKKKGKKNAKKRSRNDGDDSDDEEVVSHMSDEEEDDEDGKKSKKTKKNGRKRQKTGEDEGDSLADQLRMGAFQKDNEEADDEDLTIRFVPRRRLQKQREETPTTEGDQMDLELEIPDDDTPAASASSIPSPAKKIGGRRAAIVEDDEVEAAPAKPAAPKRLNLRFDTQKDDEDRMELDIPEDDASVPQQPNSSASQSVGKKAGRRVIDEDDE